jgi:hypothetical protein
MICCHIYFVRFADIGGIVDHHYLSSFCICYKRDAQLSQINTSECFSQTVTEATSGAGTAYPSGAPEFTSGF